MSGNFEEETVQNVRESSQRKEGEVKLNLLKG